LEGISLEVSEAYGVTSIWILADEAGGLSYLSTQYGWAADNIVAAEVVLANGTIVTATSTSNVDLFNVLRGGGNNFGIVTTYTLQTHPLGEVCVAVLYKNC
jgi:FAD/FMN-containing dehydrogenase